MGATMRGAAKLGRLPIFELATLLAAAAALGCGEDGRSFDVQLTWSQAPRLDPLAPEVGLTGLRVRVFGEDPLDEAIVDLSIAEAGRPVAVSGFLGERIDVEVEGFDAAGAVVAYGRGTVPAEGPVSVALRRNLAYVTHRPNRGQAQPARWIYAIDLARRELVDRIRLPGNDPIARAIRPRGGASMVVIWRDGARSSVAEISLEDHGLGAPIELPAAHDVVLAGPLGAVAVGGGQVSLVDFSAGTAERIGPPVGGRVLDSALGGEGLRALVAVDVAPGLLLIDLVRREVSAVNVLPDPGGVAADGLGRIAYVSSRSTGQVAAFDLATRRAQAFVGGSFAAPVDLTVYSESLRAVLGLDRSERIGRILSFHVPSETGLPVELAVETLEAPAGLATDGTGRRAVAVSTGSSTATAGLTVVDSFVDRLEGSSQLYPADPEDTFRLSSGADGRPPVRGRQRYQPSSVAVAYGR